MGPILPQHVNQERQQAGLIKQRISDLRITMFRDVFGRIASQKYLMAISSKAMEDRLESDPFGVSEKPARMPNLKEIAEKTDLRPEAVFALNSANTALEILGLGEVEQQVDQVLGINRDGNDKSVIIPCG